MSRLTNSLGVLMACDLSNTALHYSYSSAISSGSDLGRIPSLRPWTPLLVGQALPDNDGWREEPTVSSSANPIWFSKKQYR